VVANRFSFGLNEGRNTQLTRYRSHDFLGTTTIFRLHDSIIRWPTDPETSNEFSGWYSLGRDLKVSRNRLPSRRQS